MQTEPNSRRRFIRCALLASAAPLLPLALGRHALAADLPPLPADNATAKALSYVETTEGLSHAAYKPGSLCSNCQFIQGADSDARRPCTLFPGFSVAKEGWCSAWAKKPG
jgi:hypothetical protein